jgi:hypothetical protein
MASFLLLSLLTPLHSVFINQTILLLLLASHLSTLHGTLRAYACTCLLSISSPSDNTQAFRHVKLSLVKPFQALFRIALDSEILIS